MQRVVVIGAGGHGREVAEIVRDRQRHGDAVAVLGFVDDDERLHGREILGWPVLGSVSWLATDREDVRVICAIGTPATCRAVVTRVLAYGCRFTSAVSPRAYVSPSARLGQGTMVFPGAVVQTDVEVQDYCTLNVAATVSHDSVVGRFTTINPGAHLAGNVTTGECCYVGMGANVIQGRRIGDGAVVGAGAVVIDDVPPAVTVVGVPARVVAPRPGPATS